MECKKLFSALKFIEKHLATKHAAALGAQILDEVSLFSL